MTTLVAPPAIEPSSITFSVLYPASPASNVRSSQNTTKRCARPSTRSAISGRSVRSALSTSISRSPFAPYFASIAFTSDDLPVPRDPVSSTLFAGNPATNCRVLRSMTSFWSSTATRSSRRITCGWPISGRYPRPPLLRQRAAVTRVQSGSGANGGSSASTRSSTPSARAISAARSSLMLRAVVGIDGDVLVRKVARPHSGRRLAATEIHADADFVLLHDALAVLFAIAGGAAAAVDHQHVVEPDRTARGLRVRRGGIADRAHDAAQVRVRCEERRFDQRRMRDAKRDAPAFLDIASPLDPDRDELGRALAVAHDRLRQFARACFDRGADGRTARMGCRRDRREFRAPRGGQDETVVGRRIAVHGGAVE